MKTSAFILLMGIALMGCSKAPEIVRQEGWTDAQVTSSTNECVTTERTAGETEASANKFCTCLINRVSEKMTFQVYTAPHSSETAKVFEDQVTECSKP